MAVRVKDLNLDATVPTITFRAEFSKMRITRTRYLTQETAETLRLWLKKKYESRWTNVYVNGAKKNLWVEPKTSPDDLVFGGWTYEADKQSRDPYAVYDRIQELFRNLIASVGLDELEDHGHRRKITLNSFRHFVKSQISDLGYADFSEYFIGHAGSTYYDRPEKERLALYKKIEPYLTFVDVGALEAKGADYETRMSQLQAELANERAEREKLYRLLYSQGVIKDPSSP